MLHTWTARACGQLRAGEKKQEPFDISSCSRVLAFPPEEILHPLNKSWDRIITWGKAIEQAGMLAKLKLRLGSV
jgi:hypothetical protein